MTSRIEEVTSGWEPAAEPSSIAQEFGKGRVLIGRARADSKSCH